MSLRDKEKHESWMTAAAAQAIRPEDPDGYWDGRPYFFLPLPSSEHPKAGYHIWHDVDLQQWIDRKDNKNIDYIVNIAISLQIRGGLAKVLSEAMGHSFDSLEDIHNHTTILALKDLLKSNTHLLPLRDANWIDVGSGDGSVTTQAVADFGLKSITHIDSSKDAKDHFIHRLRTRKSRIEELFLHEEIQKVQPWMLKSSRHNGTFLINPWPQPKILQSTFKLSRQLAENSHFRVASIVDNDDKDLLSHFAELEGFKILTAVPSQSNTSIIFGLR